MPYDKPLPKINADNRPFWNGCREHQLRFQRCRDCRHVRWPPSEICPQCFSTDTAWMVSKGIGRVYTYAVYHTAFLPEFAADLPYIVAVVALEEGPRLLTNIVDCRPGAVACGMPVAVAWEDIDDSLTLPKFRPLSHDPA